jgi:hypothetical protein
MVGLGGTGVGVRNLKLDDTPGRQTSYYLLDPAIDFAHSAIPHSSPESSKRTRDPHLSSLFSRVHISVATRQRSKSDPPESFLTALGFSALLSPGSCIGRVGLAIKPSRSIIPLDSRGCDKFSPDRISTWRDRNRSRCSTRPLNSCTPSPPTSSTRRPAEEGNRAQWVPRCELTGMRRVWCTAQRYAPLVSLSHST